MAVFLIVTIPFTSCADTPHPSLVVLGIAQDGGRPQMGDDGSSASPRLATSLALIGSSGQRWIFEATPDFRDQMRTLHRLYPPQPEGPYLDGVFLTHAHIGHYTGLMFLGFESMGASSIRVYAMPRMAEFLTNHGPWSQLVKYQNIDLEVMTAATAIALEDDLQVTPILVPHRPEFSEVVGYRIQGPRRSAFFVPDIDSWEQWDAWGVAIEDVVEDVDVALLDATFYADGEVKGRDMSGFPHPRIVDSMTRLESLTSTHQIIFIHLNHTNPALNEDSAESIEIRRRGFHVARKGQVIEL